MIRKYKLATLLFVVVLCFSACGSTGGTASTPADMGNQGSSTPQEIISPQESKEETSSDTVQSPEPVEQTEEAQPEPDLIDGMRPEIKEAIDSYEEFINTYCEFLETYDSTNAMMLMKYAEMMNSYAELSEKFEALEDEDLNDEELKYYTQVSLRCSSRVLEASANLTSDMSGLVSGLSDLAGANP